MWISLQPIKTKINMSCSLNTTNNKSDGIWKMMEFESLQELLQLFILII